MQRRFQRLFSLLFLPTSACSVDTDQRGVSRPQGEACDIGAFELEQRTNLSTF